MHPSQFEYFAPSGLEEALRLVAQYGEEGKIMAGGQSLIPLLKLRLASFPYIIDISEIKGMNYIREEDDFLNIGALTTINDLEESEVIKNRYGIIHEAASQIADPQVRNRGTVGGNISHGDPSNDMPAVMIALGARFKVEGSKGERFINSDSFILDPFTTSLEDGEILTEVSIPVPKENSGGCYIKQKKNAGDFSVAAVAVHLTLGAHDVIEKAGIGLTSVAPKPVRAGKAEKYLEGKKLDDSLVREVSKIVVEESDPSTDFYGTESFKRKVLGRISTEAVHLAYERATVR